MLDRPEPESLRESSSDALTWYTTDQVAELLQVKPDTVRDYIAAGKLDAKKLGGGRSWRISREALKKFAYSQYGREET